MDISLEKIDLVKDRTGLGYKEAKEILEACDGNVIDAIISAEEKGESANKEMKTYTNAILSNLKEHAKKGNAMRVIVRKDDQKLINIPLTVGMIGAVLAPWGIIAGLIATFGTSCKVTIVKEDGTVIDVSSYLDKGAEKGKEYFDIAKDKGEEVYKAAKSYASSAMEKAKESKDKMSNMSKGAENDVAEGVKDAGEQIDLEDEIN